MYGLNRKPSLNIIEILPERSNTFWILLDIRVSPQWASAMMSRSVEMFYGRFYKSGD